MTGRTDSLGRGVARLVWQWSDQEQQSVATTQRLFADELQRQGIGHLQLSSTSGKPTMQGGTHHHMGTTRMSSNPADGVVDADGRVHGVKNLYVAGSSVFPTGGFQNPTLLLVALAVRLGRHVARPDRAPDLVQPSPPSPTVEGVRPTATGSSGVG